MEENTGTPAANLTEHVDSHDSESYRIPLWMYPIFFLLCLAAVSVDKWYKPVTTSLGNMF
jgi:hypothetical protein